MFGLKEWWRRRQLGRYAFADAVWREVCDELPLLQGLDVDELEDLRALATLFSGEKSLVPVQGLDLTPAMRVNIAAQACLPILRLGLEWYAGWTTVLVYPGEFVHRREELDEVGLMHEWDEIMGGESWERGPVILSWTDVAASGRLDGYNVVVHELAHKLDMLNGEPNGFPPLHRNMDIPAWSGAFAGSFADLNAQLDRGEEPRLDPYAAEDPGEFFAVMSEYFFELPQLLNDVYPQVYRQLGQFYRQDPLRRLDR